MDRKGIFVLTEDVKLYKKYIDPTNIPDNEVCYYEVSIWLQRIRHWWHRISGYRISWNTLLYLSVPGIVLQGIKIVKEKRVDSIFTTINAKGAFFLAAYFIHLIMNLPLIVYKIDLLDQSLTIERVMQYLFQGKILKSAKKVFAISEALRDFCCEKWHVSAEILPIPIPFNDRKENSAIQTSIKNQQCSTVLYTGFIYDAHIDSLQNLVNVINSISSDQIKLLLCTPATPVELRKIGIFGKKVDSCFVSREEALVLQRNSDVLFLPQAFQPSNNKVADTFFPTKTVEYLTSGTPILVHGPDSCQIVKYAKANGFALVVDRPDVERLREALMRLLQDEDLRHQLVENAWRTARKHDAKVIATRVKEALHS